MIDHVRTSLSEADVVALIVDAASPSARAISTSSRCSTRRCEESDRHPQQDRPLEEAKASAADAAVQRARTVRRDRADLRETGEGVEDLVDLLFATSRGPPLYPTEEYTTQPERFFAAEIVREKLLAHTADELPYTTAVAVDRWEGRGKNLIKIYTTIVVERESQKPIVIGKRGDMIKRIGTEARLELEAILGTKVFLDLHVAVHDRWREDERFLGELDWPLSS